MVSSFLQGEIEASIARMDKARELGLRQEQLNLQRQGMEYEKSASEKRLGLYERELGQQKEQFEKNLAMKEEEIAKQNRAAKWSGVGTMIAAAPTAYKIGKGIMDAVSPTTGVTKPELIGEIGSRGTAGVGGTGFGGGVPGAMTAGATSTGATYGGLTGAEMAGASGYAPAGLSVGTGAGAGVGAAGAATMGDIVATGAPYGMSAAGTAGGTAAGGAAGGGFGAYAGPAAAALIPIMTMYTGNLSTRKKRHAKEDWFYRLSPEQQAAYLQYQGKLAQWNQGFGAVSGESWSNDPLAGGYVGPEFTRPEIPDWFGENMYYAGPTEGFASTEERRKALMNQVNWNIGTPGVNYIPRLNY